MNTDKEKFHILIVEDMKLPAELLKSSIEEAIESADVEIQPDFATALSMLNPQRPFDVIILDLYQGDPNDFSAKEGQKIWEQVWNIKFVPIIIYTAGDFDLDPPPPANNPFIKCITKGVEGPGAVSRYLSSLRPHLLALRTIESQLEKTTHSVLKSAAPVIWELNDVNDSDRAELLLRTVQRRLAAVMDLAGTNSSGVLRSWEFYIYPPLEDCILMGDVLRENGSDPSKPDSYRIVLTPSCDLQINNGKRKVSNILTARCHAISSFINILGIKKKDLAEKLPRYLTESQVGGYVPLPALSGVLPHMAVYLRELELISVDEISSSESSHRFQRILSLDSPFREHVAWAYVQMAGRPGVPDRDMSQWTEQIIATIIPEESP